MIIDIRKYITSYQCPVCNIIQDNINYYTETAFLCECGVLLDFVNEKIYKDTNDNYEHINPYRWINPIIDYEWNGL